MNTTVLQLMRARVRALLERHETTPTAVARALGRSGTWLRRKLDEREATRPLLVEDLDLVLRHLGEPAEVLLRPVLLPGDIEVLRFCVRPREAGELLRVFRDGERAAARLEAQHLLQRGHSAAFVTTADGARLFETAA